VTGMSDLKSQDIIKVVDALIGPTTATGSEDKDRVIRNNLCKTIDLINWLLDGIVDSAGTRHAVEDSARLVGETAFGALYEWRDWMPGAIEACDAAWIRHMTRKEQADE